MKTSLDVNLVNREQMLLRLRAEVVGPDPAGSPVALTDRQSMSWEDFRAARKQLDGEEIVWQDPPTRRFGAGILFPQGADEMLVGTAAAPSGDLSPGSPDLRPDGAQPDDSIQDEGKQARFDGGDDADEESVTLANSFRPSALGLSFLADLGQESAGFCVELVNVGRVASSRTIEGPCGIYRPITLNVGAAVGKPGTPRKIWLRQPLIDADGRLPKKPFTTAEVLQAKEPIRVPIADSMELVVVSRTWRGAPTANHRLLTVCLVNKRRATREDLDLACLYQSGLRVTGISAIDWIDAYPEYLAGAFRDAEPLADENVNRVLYRDNRTFAIGHGCGADWVEGRPERVASIWTDVLPVFETPSTSADLVVVGPDGVRRNLKVSMRSLAGLAGTGDGMEEADALLREYRAWIKGLESKVSSIPVSDRPTATALIEKCRECAARIDGGIDLLRSRGEMADRVRNAFQLANHAMLIAQLRTRMPLRTPAKDEGGRLSWDLPMANADPAVPSEVHGYWRPFQIAFLLMSLRGVVDDTHADRETVDLIWFPTGGGKTEAYLGLTAFTVFFNALSGAGTAGVDVLMRYTLRLLTAQQFQRAAVLFCAMEHLRRNDVATLGKRPFRIGLWVGGSSTPNRRADALEKLRSLQRDPDAENPYVLLRCPWCASKFGPHEFSGGTVPSGRTAIGRGRRASRSEILGYSKERIGSVDTVVYRCADMRCEFGGLPGHGTAGLPIVVIDDDLLESPPNLLIGTVDKFAMLAWTPEARSIFGLGSDGKHAGLPPTLIIQDELHLISGPLGSMVGAYETVIEALCMDPLGGMVKSKIVASTATISRAREQVNALYARQSVNLFPPSGLDAADSFFAREAVDDNGQPRPGRMYVGVLAPAHGSVQTSEARVFATLMQHAALLDGEPSDLDPWWTLLVFFNSLRELGGALTLFSADTREYLRVILSRQGIDYTKIRQLFHVEELTSRIRGDHIPRLLERLEVPLRTREGHASAGSGPSAIDACLASNIIEVGVDISRLSLMAIVGQPKTTSQYIQVSSRVGRDLNKPGLVTVIYGQTKPRDRSHYEKFRSYHQKLYAQVEPTSVTPFSPPAVDRALHGLVVAMIRQLGDLTSLAQCPDPFPLEVGSALRLRIEETIEERARRVAPDEVPAVMQKLKLRLDQWRAWSPASYGSFGRQPEDAPLMYPAGSAERPEWRGRSWPTMSSLRNVDASCEADVTDAYLPVPGGRA
jgi:hypothetical protein